MSTSFKPLTGSLQAVSEPENVLHQFVLSSFYWTLCRGIFSYKDAKWVSQFWDSL